MLLAMRELVTIQRSRGALSGLTEAQVPSFIAAGLKRRVTRPEATLQPSAGAACAPGSVVKVRAPERALEIQRETIVVPPDPLENQPGTILLLRKPLSPGSLGARDACAGEFNEERFILPAAPENSTRINGHTAQPTD